MITKNQADEIVQKYDSFYCKEIEVNNTKLYLYNYIIADYQAFQSDPLSRELRGLVITQEPQQIFLSVPKFFNINETQETQLSLLQNLPIKKVQEKLDGSLISVILLNGEIVVKSKASFVSPQAVLAQNIIDQSSSLKYFILDCFANNFQPFFELIGPDNKHVIDYPENSLQLIMVRDQDGHFIDVDKFDYDFTVASCEYTWEELISKQLTEKGSEGWVVKYGNTKSPDILKVKTKEFFELHKIHEESDSYKVLLKRTLDEDMDDILSIVPENKKEKLQEMMKVISDYLVSYVIEIEAIVKPGDNHCRATFVKKHITHQYFNVIMNALKGRDVKELLVDHIKRKNNREEKAKKFIQDLLN